MAAKKITLYTAGKDERPMVKIPAGEFLYGEDQEKVGTKEFFIDQHHVTNAEYKKFVDATEHKQPQHWRGGTYPEGKADHPDRNEQFEFINKKSKNRLQSAIP